MLIDKSTGIGCAQSIASKKISRQLISDGIMGQPILRRPRKQAYDLVCLIDRYEYYINANKQKVEELSDVALWTPSFIEPEVWREAVKHFKILSPLDKNVEKFLLPYMDAYLNNLSEADLITLVHDF